MTAISERIRHLSDRFETVIAGVAPERWQDPSPCDEWKARDIVHHVVEVHGMMLKPLRRTLSEAPGVSDDALAAFRAARADVAVVLDDPALATTEYDSYFGHAAVQQTIDDFLGFDLVVHAWDLARATGQAYSIEQAEVDHVSAQVARLGDAIRTPGVCGPPVDVPEDSSAQDRLLAVLGRDPR